MGSPKSNIAFRAVHIIKGNHSQSDWRKEFKNIDKISFFYIIETTGNHNNSK